MNYCTACGTYYPNGLIHSCPRWQKGGYSTTANPIVAAPPLTEADVRRIIREELVRMSAYESHRTN
jgi:hypothetical protein